MLRLMRWRNSVGLNDREELSGTTDGHERGEMVVVGSEVLVSCEAGEDDGFRVEPLQLVDGGMLDAV